MRWCQQTIYMAEPIGFLTRCSLHMALLFILFQWAIWKQLKSILIQTPNFKSYNFIDSIGIISYLDSSNTDFIVEGINYYKPMQYHFGFSYNPKDNSDLTVSTEIQYNKFDFPSINYFKNSSIYKFGFEYFLPSNIPIRAGLIYKQSPIQTLPDQSIITWGSGLIHGQFECDFSFSQEV